MEQRRKQSKTAFSGISEQCFAEIKQRLKREHPKVVKTLRNRVDR
jgi:hypothetical protein